MDYAPAEISALEQYEVSVKEQSMRRAVRKRQLEVTCVDLKRKIVEGIRDFDERLLVLYKVHTSTQFLFHAHEKLN